MAQYNLYPALGLKGGGGLGASMVGETCRLRPHSSRWIRSKSRFFWLFIKKCRLRPKVTSMNLKWGCINKCRGGGAKL